MGDILMTIDSTNPAPFASFAMMAKTTIFSYEPVLKCLQGKRESSLSTCLPYTVCCYLFLGIEGKAGYLNSRQETFGLPHG